MRFLINASSCLVPGRLDKPGVDSWLIASTPHNPAGDWDVEGNKLLRVGVYDVTAKSKMRSFPDSYIPAA